MVTGKENKRELRYKYINRRFHTQCSLFIHFGAASAADAVPSQIPICLNSHSGRRTGHSRNLSFMNQIKSTRRVREKRAQHIITWHPLITFHASPTLGPFSSKSVPKIHFLFRPKAATGHTQPQKPTDHSARNRARVTNPEQKTTPTDSTTVTGRSFLENARRSRAKLSFFFVCFQLPLLVSLTPQLPQTVRNERGFPGTRNQNQTVVRDTRFPGERALPTIDAPSELSREKRKNLSIASPTNSARWAKRQPTDRPTRS